jgi:uncharacterized protein YraI
MSCKKISVFLVILLVIFAWMVASPSSAGAFQASTPTPTAGGRPFITVTYVEPINVRGGPNSVYYPIVGSLPVGAVVEAIGRSPGGEWIKISYPDALDGSGVGWVYAPLVTLSPGFLPVVEPPPTAIPYGKPTLDPDFVASLQPAPTNTRPPTFTAPPPLEVPHYENEVDGGGVSSGAVILVLTSIGFLGLLVNAFQRRRG